MKRQLRKLNKTVLILMMLLLSMNAIMATAYAAQAGWETVGAEGFTSGEGNYSNIAFDSYGTPYIVYVDASTDPNHGTATVMKFNGGNWEVVADAAFSSGTTVYTYLTIDKDNKLYVSYSDGSKSGKATVKTLLSLSLIDLAATGGNTTANLTFTIPSEATAILIEQSTDGITWTTATTGVLAPTASSATVTGLTNGTSYKFRIAVTAVESGYSNVASATPSSPGGPGPGPGTDTSSTPAQAPNTSTTVILSVITPSGQAVNTPITQVIGSNLTLAGVLMGADGKSLGLGDIEIKDGQPIKLPALATGTYMLVLNVIAPTGEKLAGKVAKLTIDAAGNANIDSELIDPYGIIRDSVTGMPVDGVKVSLHWSDTTLNISKKRVPHALVILPELPDFAPNKNHDPQISVDGGQYGWMVFPDGDYYILGVKDGYTTFDSRKDTRDEKQGTDSYIKDGIIHVGQSIVEYSFKITPKVKGSGEHEAYIKGYPDGSFQPDQGITRAELSAILSRTMAKKDGGLAINYPDVVDKHWAASVIKAAAQQGWLRGYENGHFKPQGKVTRAELAQMLINVHGWTADGEPSFTDVSGHWAAKAIAAVEKQGLMSGYEDSTFRPNQSITRAEIVTIFNSLLNRSNTVLTHNSPAWNDITPAHWAFTNIMEASVEHSYTLYETGTEQWAD